MCWSCVSRLWITAVMLDSLLCQTDALERRGAMSLQVQGGREGWWPACLAIGKAPFYAHGAFRDPEFEASYPLSARDFAKIPLEGNYAGIVRVLQKLAAGGTVNIVVLGGSETGGACCLQKMKGSKPVLWKSCAWSARLTHWLQATFPQGTVVLRNLAIGGYTTGVIHSAVGAMFSAEGMDQTDLVILDTLPNDAYPMGGLAGLGTKYDRHQTVSITYEALVRTIHAISPDIAVFSIVAGCYKCIETKHSQLDVIQYYDLAHVDYAKLVSQSPAERQQLLWDNRTHAGPAENDCHPHWHTHQITADVIENAWGRAWALACSSPPAALPALPRQTFWEERILKQFPTCVRPSSYFSALRASSPGTPQPIEQHGWRLFEDRPGKPGWIATEEGANITFKVRFAAQPQFGITYLVSYQGMGAANVTLGGKSELLKATDTSQQVSQSVTTWFWDRTRYVPFSEMELHIQTVGTGKFKINEIVSC
mmetsp:Transcript_86462/g.209656  ORF Transcript_86462/g.209656 Transcript_86462/m.209656 type:complete len:480 (-) Transcript_86462:148-1587(-)